MLSLRWIKDYTKCFLIECSRNATNTTSQPRSLTPEMCDLEEGSQRLIDDGVLAYHHARRLSASSFANTKKSIVKKWIDGLRRDSDTQAQRSATERSAMRRDASWKPFHVAVPRGSAAAFERRWFMPHDNAGVAPHESESLPLKRLSRSRSPTA